jgi:hypothetical protein
VVTFPDVNRTLGPANVTEFMAFHEHHHGWF